MQAHRTVDDSERALKLGGKGMTGRAGECQG